MSRISRAVDASVAPSRPEPDGPAKASPDGLKTIRFHRGEGTTNQPISTWAKLMIFAEPISCEMDTLSSLAYGWSTSTTSL